MRKAGLLALMLALSLAAAGPALSQGPRAAKPQVEAIAGRNTIRSLPNDPAGIVYLFHGSGGSEAFATRLHSRRVIEKLAARGYGFASAPSANRQAPARWDLASLDPAANADVAYMLALHEALIRRGEIRRETPVFTMGMSNGGGFANLFAVAAAAKGLPVRAIADYMGPIPAPARTGAGTFPPLFVVLAENDGLVSPDVVGPIARRLADGGAKVELHLMREQAVSAETFRNIAGADGKAIMEGLIANKVIDASGRRLVFRDRTRIDRPEMAELATMAPAGPYQRDIVNELLIAWAGHQMRSDFADEQVRFFDQALAR